MMHRVMIDTAAYDTCREAVDHAFDLFPVALDATIARMMGVEPSALRFLEVAKEHGLGDYEAESIEIVGSLTPVPDFKLPARTAHDAGHIREFLQSRARMRPQVDPALCTACETCVEQCPASALGERRFAGSRP
jgi:ferredoxin